MLDANGGADALDGERHHDLASGSADAVGSGPGPGEDEPAVGEQLEEAPAHPVVRTHRHPVVTADPGVDLRHPALPLTEPRRVEEALIDRARRGLDPDPALNLLSGHAMSCCHAP